ncbi:hypothetical protein ACFW04_013638 [Cataglyphis niger]
MAPRKRNRYGVEKRRAKRDREIALVGLSLPLKFSEKHLRDWRRNIGKFSRTGSVDTLPPLQKVVKRSNWNYASAADHLARTIVQKSYPELEVTPEPLNLLREAIVSELEEIRECRLLRFTGTASELDTSLSGKVPSLRWAWMLQKRHRTAVWVSDPPMPAAVVLRLESQNPDIATANWQIFIEIVGLFPEEGNLILGIPESSVLKLRARTLGLIMGSNRSLCLLGARSEAMGQEEFQPASDL